VPEHAVRTLADRRQFPAQKIGDDWRFLRKALNDRMTYGEDYPRRPWAYPPEFFLESPLVDELLHVLEERLASTMRPEAPPKPGSKEAVSRHVGIWRDDPTAGAMLEEIYKRRGGE
jgi:hypothetical protein